MLLMLFRDLSSTNYNYSIDHLFCLFGSSCLQHSTVSFWCVKPWIWLCFISLELFLYYSIVDFLYHLSVLSCLGNPMDSAAWRATVHEVSKESDRTERRTLSPFFHFQTHKTWIWDSRDGKNIMLWTEPRESWWPQKPETQFKAYKRIILMLDRPSS